MKYGKFIIFSLLMLILQNYVGSLCCMLHPDTNMFLIEMSEEFDAECKNNFFYDEDTTQSNELDIQVIKIDKDGIPYLKIENQIFKSYIVYIVENAIKRNLLHAIPSAFFKCFEKLGHEENLFSENDINEIISIGLDLLKEREKAFRPSHPTIVGPLLCETSVVINLLMTLQNLITQCCSNHVLDIIVTFSNINDIKNTLTSCCENIINNFNSTFTSLAEFENTLTNCCTVEFYDLSGTYSALNYGFNSTETIITADFNGTVTLLNAITNVLNEIQITFSLNCYNFQNQISTCCSLLEMEFAQLIPQVLNSESIVQSFLGHECNDAAIAKKCLAPFTNCQSVQTCG